MNAGTGYMDGDQHVLSLRVYYEDTDAEGIVYYANYLKFAERGRTEMLRCAGISQSALSAEHGVAFAVCDCRVKYRAPARLDDVIEVRSRLTELRGASVEAAQSIARDGQELVHLDVRVACVDHSGRPGRLPATVRTALAPYCQGLERG